MRAAANAAAEVLLAETSSGSVRFRLGDTPDEAGGAASASTSSSASFGDLAMAAASMRSSASFAADQPVGRGRGESPAGAQDLERCGQGWGGSAAHGSGHDGGGERLPLEELERRIQELHEEEEEDGGGNASALISHRHSPRDEERHEHDDLSRGREQHWVVTPGDAQSCQGRRLRWTWKRT